MRSLIDPRRFLLLVIIILLPIMVISQSTINVQNKQPTTIKPSCKQSEMDNCSQKLLMITDKNFHYPISLDEMNIRCKEMKSLGKCIKEYSQKCLTSIVWRQSFSIVTHGIIKTNKALCRNLKRRQAFAAFGSSCANRLQKTLNSYVEDMNRIMFGILTYPVKKLRLPLSCCNYYKFQNRVLEMYTEQCPQHVTEMERLLKGFTRDSLSLICGSYTEHSEKCSLIIEKTPNWNKTMESEIFISTYVDMLNNFL